MKSKAKFNSVPLYLKKPLGFSLVSVIFIIVILTLIGTYLVRIGTIANATGQYGMQGVRAFYAARSGLEWASMRIVQLSACPPTTTLNFTQGGLQGFSAQVTCSFVTATEGTTYNLYTITSQGFSGTLGTSGYVSRTMVQTLVN